MTRPVRHALGLASFLPALTMASLPTLVEAAPGWGGASTSLAIGGSLVLLSAAIAVVLSFAWLAAGVEIWGSGRRLAWSIGLVLFGVALAPVFWALTIRPDRVATG